MTASADTTGDSSLTGSVKLGVAVLDPYDQRDEDESELHVNPLDGPEAFLDALASLMQRDHRHA